MSAVPPLQLDLQKLKDGDKDTITSLALHLLLDLRKQFARSQIKEADLFDIAQDIVMRIVHDPAQFADLGSEEKILQYCAKIARNSAVHQQRSTQRESDFKPAEIPAPKTSEVRVLLPEAERIRRALEQLSEDQQRIINLSFRVGLSMLEVAQALGVPLSSAYALRYRALSNLRSHLREAGTEEHEQ